MGVPAVEGERADPRTVVGGHQLRGAARHQPHRAGAIGAGLRLHVVALRGLVERKALLQRARQRGIAVLIEFEEPHRGIFRSLRQRDRRPADRRRRTAQHQRRGRTDRKRARHPLAFRQAFQRAVEPAGLHAPWPRKAAFEHVLPVEMRTVAIRRRHRMNHGSLLLAIHPREFRHRRMQRKEIVEPYSCVRPARRERDRTMQAGIFRIANRRDGGEPIQRAAQDDDHQPRIAAIGGAREFRQIGPCRKGGAAEQQRASRRRRRSSGLRSNHLSFPWTSSPLEFRRHQQQRQRLLPRFRALDGPPRLR